MEGRWWGPPLSHCLLHCPQVPVASWFDNMADTELLDLLPFFERLSKVEDVYSVLKKQRTNS